MSEFGQKFPRWLGPIIGAGIGVVLACRGMKRQGDFNWKLLARGELDWMLPIVGVLLGILGGGVLWLLDAPPPTEERRASVLGSLLAVLAIFPRGLPGRGTDIRHFSISDESTCEGLAERCQPPGVGAVHSNYDH